MTSQRSLVEVVEAAYDVVADDELWLRGLLEAVQPELDGGFGVGAQLVDASVPENYRTSSLVARGIPDSLMKALLICVPTLTADQVRALFYGGPVATMVSACGADIFDGPLQQEHLVAALGVHDILGVNAMDPTGRGCNIAASRAQATTTLPPAFVRTWSRIASHIAAGLRLRRGPVAPGNDLAAGAEAVLSPSGKTVHAEEPASSREARAALKDAALAVDRARRLAKRDPEEAIALWRGLVAGRWSLVDRFDTDGRRFLVVKRNDPEPAGPPPPALTLPERQAVGYAALGHSNKLIAYELGLPESTIAARLTKAAKKLGCPSRVALVRLVAGPVE